MMTEFSFLGEQLTL